MFYKQYFDHRLDILELYLTVRDPGTAKAAEAYDGLRKLLINANKGTLVHLAHLAELHRIAAAASSVEPVLAKVGEFMSQIGLVTVNDASQADLFEFIGGQGSSAVVDSPAYVTRNGSGEVGVVIRGVAHYEEVSTDDAYLPSSALHDDDANEVSPAADSGVGASEEDEAGAAS